MIGVFDSDPMIRPDASAMLSTVSPMYFAPIITIYVLLHSEYAI